ncbi:MAG TPA: hypothetical protein VK942_22165, partial [Actinomycetes bacterium]|nr:hypothetical protein [Actinomycetes bacterium]
MAERTLKISIVGEDRNGSVRRTFREVENDGNRLARGFTSVRASVGGNMRSTLGIVTKTTGAIVASFAAVKVVGFLKGAIDEAREAEKVGRITEARIKSTGGAANVSAKQFDTLTTSISNQVGVDDELIAAGGNMLLTFKGVRNEVGKGNDIFDQATRLAVDLAAGMNEGTVTAGGLRTANIQLGKALEDPIRGITALRRAGVSFTEQQKDQIKKLVESGRTLEAQKLIIKAVGEQFAGTAKAAADPWERLGVVWGNVKEKVGNLLLPALSSAATFVSDKLIPAAERWWQKHGPEVRDSFSKIAHTVGTFFRGLKENLEPQLKRIKDAWDDNKASLDLLVGSFGDGTDASKDGAKAAKSFGDAVVATTEFVGRASRFLDQAADKVNGFEQSMSKLGKNIHKIFVRPMLDAVNMVVQFSLGGWARIADGAATLIEHMPGGKRSGAARTLREGADQLRSFAAGANRALHSIDDETTKITAKFGFQGLEVFRVGPRGQTRLAAAGGGPIRGPGTGTSDSI